MRKIIVSEFMALDGVIENPAWTFPYWNDEINQFKADEDAITDCLLLGRVTYEAFAQAWPNSPDPGAARINGMPKYVVTNTLDTLEWNNSHILDGDMATAVQKLKQEDGQNILVYGSGKLVQGLMQAGLVDQLNIIQYPIVVGGGQTLFGNYGEEVKLKLISTKAFSTGALGLIYEIQK
jgi:dihydrofolate reductase